MRLSLFVFLFVSSLWLRVLQECTDEGVTAPQNVYPGADGAKQWLWSRAKPSEVTTGSKGGTKVSYSFVEDLVISLSRARCAYVEVGSVPQATSAFSNLGSSEIVRCVCIPLRFQLLWSVKPNF
jgi:hypothetical protein